MHYVITAMHRLVDCILGSALLAASPYYLQTEFSLGVEGRGGPRGEGVGGGVYGNRTSRDLIFQSLSIP